MRPSEQISSFIQERSLNYLLLLTGCLAGVQFTWTVEFAYGTPYLLQLGLAKSLMSLVWLAGPLSGLIIQPLVGIYSDQCRSRYGRRRPFILAGGLIVCLSILMIAYSREIAMFLCGYPELVNGKNPKVKNTTIGIAIIAFYCLDFSINVVQACCRALIVDVSPTSQQNTANAWAGRMIGLGNVLGYLMGFIDLPKNFPFFGSTQIKILCIFALITFTFTILLTCVKVHEEPLTPATLEELEQAKSISWYTPLLQILKSMKSLPKTIQKICFVQFFAWIGWFPLLFYSTSYVASKGPQKKLTDGQVVDDEGTRIGSLAMLAFAIISVATGFILPMVSLRESQVHDRHLSPFQKCLKIPSIWAISQWFFAFLMFCTWFVNDRWGAVFIVALAGISWGVTQWIPFTLLGEYIAHLSDLKGEREDIEPGSSLQSATSQAQSGNEADAFLKPSSKNGDTPTTNSANSMTTMVSSSPSSPSSSENALSAGIVLGIHNIYIVLPQFVSTFLCAAVFYMLGEPDIEDPDATTRPEDNGFDSFGFVLRLGGISSIVAGFMALKVKEISRKRDC